MKKRSGRIITLLAALSTAAALSISAFAGVPDREADLSFQVAQTQERNSGKNFIRILSPSDGQVFYQGQTISYSVNVTGTYSNFSTRPYITLVLENKSDPKKNKHIKDFTFPKDLAQGERGTFKGTIDTNGFAPGTYLFGVINWPCSNGKRLTDKEVVANGLNTPLLAIEIEISAPGEHTWDAGVVTREPDIGQPGVITYTCTKCKATRTEEIPPLQATIQKTPASVKVKAGEKGKVTVSWKKINKKNKKLLKQIKSVEVQYSTDPTFIENRVSKKVGKNKTSVSLKLKSKTTYYFRVRYVGNGGASYWSKTKSVKTR